MVDGTADHPSVLEREPEMHTYGDLFHRLDRMKTEKFELAQQNAARHVFRALYPFVNQGLVRRIVDLGCGRGAILQELQKLFAETYEGSSAAPDKCWLKLVGIDSDCTLIEDWTQRADRGVSLEFKHTDDVSIPEVVNETDETALLVLGHTIFHFARSNESFKQFLSELTPVLWIIDCHRTWDDAISTAAAADRGFSLEPVWEEESKEPGKRRIICLRTVKLDEECVSRGLVRRSDVPDEPAQVIFETAQVAVTSDKLREILRKRGYFVSLSYEYYSSWGPMSSAVFVRDLMLDAKLTNNFWYTTVSSALNEIFRSSTLPGVENQFVAVRKAIKLYKVRCAAVILPFDRIHTFARYAPLDRGTIDDSTADQRLEMVLEEPSQDQDKYPTAYGLFTCVLGRTSSIQVFPLRLIANYQMAPVDRDFNDYEASFFESCTADGSVVESDRAFFLLPIFFGRLPLFVLVLQFGDTFSELDTGPGLFRSCLLDIHQQVREVIDEQFLRARILRPFLRDAYHQLRFLVSGSPQDQRSPKEISDQAYKDLEVLVLENAIEKPWKSWVLALPGTEIKHKRTVIAEQAHLERIVRDEINRLRRDIFFRLSRELEEMGFFAADREQSPESADDPHKKPGPKHQRIILQHGLASEDKLSELVDLNNPYQDVIDWTAGKMSLLVRSGKEIQSDSDEAFQDLKAVYCRALENTGGPFRFSDRRLRCMVEIATGARTEVSIDRGCSIIRPIEEDPCQDLFVILHDLKAYWNQSVPIVSIKVENRPPVDGVTPRGLAAEVSVEFSNAPGDGGGMGQDSRHLLETLRRWCSTGTPPTEPDQTRRLIARMEVGPEIGGPAVWRSLSTELIVPESTQ
jgi:SAM-dependent methyltransferase